MNQPESQQEEPEEQNAAAAEVWGRLDQVTRTRVIELFAHSAYNFVSARFEAAAEEDRDVSSINDRLRGAKRALTAKGQRPHSSQSTSSRTRGKKVILARVRTVNTSEQA